MGKGFIFDPNRCTGCHACQVACQIENRIAPPRAWRQVYTFNARRFRNIPVLHLSMTCNHCAEPACVEACPARACSKDAATGAVTIERSRCMGCNYCSWVCAYDAPRFDPALGVMEKCTLCGHRLEKDLLPACTVACPTGALAFGRVAEGDPSATLPGIPETDLEPALAVEPIRRSESGPLCTAFGPDGSGIDEIGPTEEGRPGHRLDVAPAKISLPQEWSLLLFTAAAALIVALTATAGALPFDPLLLPGAALAVMVSSAFHLGRKSRVWRAHLNWRRSWLSREIIFFCLFAGSAALFLGVFPESTLCRAAALLAGFGALWMIDSVYHPIPRDGPMGAYSALVLPNGILFTALLGRFALLLALLAAVAACFYIRRKVLLKRSGRNPRWSLSLLRVGAGLVLPALLLLFGSPDLYWWAVGGALLGWIIDRAEFYAEMEIVTPASRMDADLGRCLGVGGPRPPFGGSRSSVGEIENG